MTEDLKQKTPSSSKLIDPSLIKQWLTQADGFEQYKSWLAQNKDVATQLEGLAATLESMVKNRQLWSGCDANKLHAFIGQSITLFNDTLGAVSSGKKAAKRLVLGVSSFLDAFKALRKEFTFYARFNPARLFHLLETVDAHGPPQHMASIVDSMGLFAQENLFLMHTFDPQSGKVGTFQQDWEKWLAWLEKRPDKLDLTPTMVNQLLTGLTTMATTHCLPALLPTALINQLLRKLADSPLPKAPSTSGRGLEGDTVLTGLRQLRTLTVDTLALADITILDMDLLTQVLDKSADAKSTSFETFAEIAEQIAKVCCEVNFLAKPPKSIATDVLTKALQLLSSATPSPTWSHCATKVLLSVGQILQSAWENIEKTSALSESASTLVAALNDNASKMSLPDIAHTLYAQVISKKKGWLDNTKNENLVTAFLQKLQAEKTKSTVGSEKLAIAVQQFAEYFCWANPNKPLPAAIVDRLNLRKPAIQENALQHRFVLALKEQTWFKARFEPCDGEKDIEEILVANKYACVDSAFKDKETGKIFIIYIDGPKHQKHQQQDQRQNEYFEILKDAKSGEPLIQEVIRIPADVNSTVENMIASAEKRLCQTEKKAEQQEQKTTKSIAHTVESPPLKEAKTSTKPQAPISLKPLYRAIDDQNVMLVSKILGQLQSKGAFKGKQENTKADILTYAVSQFDPNPNILKKLIDTLGLATITEPTSSQSSPLLKAAESGKVKAIEIFIEKTKPEQRQKNIATWQAALRAAKAQRKTDVAKRFESAGIVLPVEKSPLAESKAPPSSEPKLESNPAEEKRSVHKTSSQDNPDFHLSSCACGMCRHQQHDSNSLRTKQVEMQAHAGNPLAQYLWALQFYDFAQEKPKDEKQYFYWLKFSCAQNCAIAQYSMGVCFLNGQGVVKDDEKATWYFRLAAEQGINMAQHNLGLCYLKGIGVVKDDKKAIQYFRSAAAQGDRETLHNLGICYLTGQGVDKDVKEAIRYFRLAAEQGQKESQYNLGVQYYSGGVVNKDLKEAARYFRLAADQGDRSAQHNLGVCYLNGEGVVKDAKEATDWFKRADKQGDKGARLALGVCYSKGNGVEKNVKEAIRYFQLAADQGVMEAQYNLGDRYYTGDGVNKDLKEAARYFRLAADQGDRSAQHNLGVCCLHGYGVVKDAKEAADWFKRAAKQGDKGAQLALGVCYSKGNGVKENAEKAAGYFQLAADQGVIEAQYYLGECYLNGNGVVKDAKKATDWFKSAAKMPEAQYYLGVCYLNGNGVAKDAKEATDWFKKAAKQGERGAQYALGICFLNGNGVETNISAAMACFQNSAQQGHQPAINQLKSLSSTFKFSTPVSQIVKGAQSGWLDSPVYSSPRTDAKNSDPQTQPKKKLPTKQKPQTFTS